MRTILLAAGLAVPPPASADENIPWSDAFPDPPTANEVRVQVRPEFREFAAGEPMRLILTITNISERVIRLPVMAGVCGHLHLRLTPEDAAAHGLQPRVVNCSILAPVQRLLPGQTHHAIELLDAHIAVLKASFPPISCTWALDMHRGSIASGTMIIALSPARDELDAWWLRRLEEQSRAEVIPTVENNWDPPRASPSPP